MPENKGLVKDKADKKTKLTKKAAKSIIDSKIAQDQAKGTYMRGNKAGKMPAQMHGKELLKKAMGVFKK